MTISGNVIHTVNFFQGAFTIILALALGEALKQFVADSEERPLHWDRLPGLLCFLLIFFPFFQGMSQYLWQTYLSPATAPKFQSGFLMFDGILFVLESACFFVMSRALGPRHWRRFYTSVILLLSVDIAWAGVAVWRGVPIEIWIYLDFALIVLMLAVLWFEPHRPRAKTVPLRPMYILLAAVTISTTISYTQLTAIYLGK